MRMRKSLSLFINSFIHHYRLMKTLHFSTFFFMEKQNAVIAIAFVNNTPFH